jgi:stalled ribosome rescue protein Dom34
MKLIKKKTDIFEIKIDTIDDLYNLQIILNLDDEIYNISKRKIKIGNKNITKTLYLEIKIKMTQFNFNSLRIQGEILNENEFVPIGKSHSLNFYVDDIIKFKKNNFLKFEKELFEKCLKTNKKNLLVLFDKNELILSEFSNFSYKILLSQKNLGSKKYIPEQINENEEKFKLIQKYLNLNYSNIVFASSNFFLKPFYEHIKRIKPKMKKDIILIEFNEISFDAINKIINKINKEDLILNSVLKEESQIVSKFLKNLKENKKCSYGFKRCKNYIENNQVETLITTSNFVKKQREDDNFNEISKLFLQVEKMQGKLKILNSKFNNGQIIDGLSGICAILRF